MLAPLAPHVAEELWKRLGHPDSLTYEAFPVADPALLVDDTVICVVQVHGKVKDRLEVPNDISEDALRELALASPKVQASLENGRAHRHRPGPQARQRRPRLTPQRLPDFSGSRPRDTPYNGESRGRQHEKSGKAGGRAVGGAPGVQGCGIRAYEWLRARDRGRTLSESVVPKRQVGLNRRKP